MMAKVRKNPDFVIVTRELDALGLEWELREPTGKGHPHLLIQGHRYTIGSSPGKRLPAKLFRGSIKRFLRAKGLI